MARDEVWRLSYHPAWDLNNCWHLYFPSWNYHEVFFSFVFLLSSGGIWNQAWWGVAVKIPRAWACKGPDHDKTCCNKTNLCTAISGYPWLHFHYSSNSLLVHISSFRKMMPNQTSYPGSSASSLCLFLKSHSEWSNLMQSAHIVFLLFNIQPEEGFWEIWKIANHILSF